MKLKWKECQMHRDKRMLKSGTCYQVRALWPGYMWNRDLSPLYVHAFLNFFFFDEYVYAFNSYG